MTTTCRRILLCVAFAAGCGGGDDDAAPTPDAPPAGPDAAPPELLTPPPDGEGFQLSMTAHVEAGQEITLCRYVPLPHTSGPVDVARFESRYTGGSHHLVVYRT